MTEQSSVTAPAVAALNGIPGVLALRLLSGKVPTRGGYVVGAEKGTPDILAIIKGRAVFLEAKTPTGKLTLDQDIMHDRLRRCGAHVFTIRSVHEALDIARAALGVENG